MMLIRKKKKLSQASLGKMIGTSGDVVGRYERDEIKPPIEMATRIADALEISLDYLAGKSDLYLDNNMIKQIQLVSKLPDKEKEYVFVFLNSFIDRMKLQSVL